MVFLKRGNLSDSLIHPSTWENRLRMGPYKSVGEVPGSIHTPITSAESRWRSFYCRLTEEMELAICDWESLFLWQDTGNTGIPTSLHCRRCLCAHLRKHRGDKELQETPLLNPKGAIRCGRPTKGDADCVAVANIRLENNLSKFSSSPKHLR